MDYQTWTILGASGPNHLPPCGAARRKSVKYFQVEGNASSLWRRGGESASARQVSWQNGGESAREEKERQVFSSRGKRVKSLAARRRERRRKASILAERQQEHTRERQVSSAARQQQQHQHQHQHQAKGSVPTSHRGGARVQLVKRRRVLAWRPTSVVSCGFRGVARAEGDVQSAWREVNGATCAEDSPCLLRGL